MHGPFFRRPYDGGVNHIRVIQPSDGVYGFYDGRVEGYRFAEGPNWVDDGALSLGICSYAIVDGTEALVYDTQVSVEHAQMVRRTLQAVGVRSFSVVLSHWHLDHIAGTSVFPDAEVIASKRTSELLAIHREAIEEGTHEGPPAIDPLVLPTRTFEETLLLDVGGIRLELIHVDIHSEDATVIWLPDRRLLLAGDTVEDTVTYVAEPDRLDAHLADLDRLWQLNPKRILPDHGAPGCDRRRRLPEGADSRHAAVRRGT